MHMGTSASPDSLFLTCPISALWLPYYFLGSNRTVRLEYELPASSLQSHLWAGAKFQARMKTLKAL